MDSSSQEDFIQDPSTGNRGSLRYVLRPGYNAVDAEEEVERQRLRMLLRMPGNSEESREEILSYLQNISHTQERTPEALPEMLFSSDNSQEVEASPESDKAKEGLEILASEAPNLTETLSFPEDDVNSSPEEIVNPSPEEIVNPSPEEQQEATSAESQEEINTSKADHTYSKDWSDEGAKGSALGATQVVPGKQTAATVLHELFKDVPMDPRPCTDGYIPLTNYIKSLDPAAECPKYESVEALTTAMVKLSKCMRLKEGSKLKREDVFKGFLPEYPAPSGYIERRFRHLLKQPKQPQTVTVKKEPSESCSSHESEITVIYNPMSTEVTGNEEIDSDNSPGEHNKTNLP